MASPAETPTRTPRTRWAAVVTFALATLIVASELSMAAMALPLISDEFDVGAGTAAWVVLAYSLPLAALAIPAGRWIDDTDLRTVFLLSLVAVAATSLLAAAAPSWWLLLAGRVTQGVASAVYLAVYLPMVAATVRTDQRGRALSYISTIMMVGSMAVAPIGGYVAAWLGWRGMFLVKLPLLAMVLVLALRTIPATTHTGSRLPPPRPVLMWETLLLGGAITAVLLATDRASHHWPLATALGVIGVAMVVGWSRLPASRPVLALIRRRALGLSQLALLLTAATIGLITFLLPFFLSDVLDTGPETLGLAILFYVAAASVLAPVAGILSDRVGPLPVAIAGGALLTVGMLTMLTLDTQSGLFDLAWRLGIIGLGGALFNSPVMTAILAATPEGQAGTAGGITNVSRTLGTTIGPALTAMAWSLGGGGETGFDTGIIVLAGFGLTAVIALLAARKPTP